MRNVFAGGAVAVVLAMIVAWLQPLKETIEVLEPGIPVCSLRTLPHRQAQGPLFTEPGRICTRMEE